MEVKQIKTFLCSAIIQNDFFLQSFFTLSGLLRDLTEMHAAPHQFKTFELGGGWGGVRGKTLQLYSATNTKSIKNEKVKHSRF